MPSGDSAVTAGVPGEAVTRHQKCLHLEKVGLAAFLHDLLFDLDSFQENLVHLKSLYKVYVYVQT